MPPRRATTNRSHIADGSISGARIQAAGVRAVDAWGAVRRMAKRVSDEIDDVTSPHGIPVIGLPEDDSMVLAVAEVITVNKPSK